MKHARADYDRDRLADKNRSMERLTKHHEITEKWIGIARLRLSRNEYGLAREALDKCVEELKELGP